MMNGSSSGISAVKHDDQPDPDAIKMFIGQIPKTWGEVEVRKLLEVYGPIYQLNILRDKGSVISKGCCFVTFYTRKAALDAQNDLHNVKTLPGVHHCVQMKPADSENKSEDRKLFVGMLCKSLTEQDLRLIFNPFGNIEECRILMNPDATSKGCAFITFSKRISAQNAIRHMHQSTTMEGCSAPIVVKIADSPKDKERKKNQMQFAQQLNQITNQWKTLTGLAALGPVLQSLASCNNQLNLGSNGNNNQMTGGLNQTQVQQALALAAAAQTLLNNPQVGLNTLNPNGASSSHIGSSMGSQMGSASPTPFPSGSINNGFGSGCSSTSPLEQIGLLNSSSVGTMGVDMGHSSATSSSAAAFNPTINMLANMAAFAQPSSQYNHTMLPHQNNSPVGSHKEGPDGANLFIYHLPTQFTDHDLMQAFMPFGSIVSAKVFIDKQTNLSKCFGFISYDNPTSAEHAIHVMHGHQIGMKRLKVQLKRGKGDSKPY
ncbi:unnamed protein product [Clavelina lepadiformis]|uniref:RRM domain-containing protein n=1 Tax=Clavelina lepadiformis TaxID=159417 RepID=A0ABP0H042_CLALP